MVRHDNVITPPIRQRHGVKHSSFFGFLLVSEGFRGEVSEVGWLGECAANTPFHGSNGKRHRCSFRYFSPFQTEQLRQNGILPKAGIGVFEKIQKTFKRESFKQSCKHCHKNKKGKVMVGINQYPL